MKTLTKALTIQAATRILVLRALGWDDLQYGQFQFETGLEYLHRYFGDDEGIISHASKHPLFWKWFRNHWHNRDYEFLQHTKHLPVIAKIREYKALHNMQGFRYKPHRVVMEKYIYEEMIYPITHEEVNQ